MLSESNPAPITRILFCMADLEKIWVIVEGLA
jgi:hypothetical protein